jgi:soluble lytic murein transglycosylase-like protein
MSRDTSLEQLRPALVAAGLFALAVFAVVATPGTRPFKPQQTAETKMLAQLLTPVESTPQVELPQPIFEAESAMPVSERLARWNKFIDEASRRFGVPRDWIIEVMRQESGGRTVLQGDLPITSEMGAMGLMQVMPETYRDMRIDHRLADDPYDPRNSVLAGTAYLKFLHGKYGYPALFAAYNTGPGNLEANLLGKKNLPQETIAYLANIRVRLGDKSAAEGLKGAGALTATATLTRPDGQQVSIDAANVRAVRAVLPGEYPPSAAAVVDMGQVKQAVQEDVAAATQLLKKAGAKI